MSQASSNQRPAWYADASYQAMYSGRVRLSHTFPYFVALPNIAVSSLENIMRSNAKSNAKSDADRLCLPYETAWASAFRMRHIDVAPGS